MAITPDTEIRKLPANDMFQLAQYLNENNRWIDVMSIIPSDKDVNKKLFSSDNIMQIRSAILEQQRSGAEIFLNEWSTYGKNRPTCQSLLNLLIQLEFYKAADHLAMGILKMPRPKRFGKAREIPDEEIEAMIRNARQIKILNERITELKNEIVIDTKNESSMQKPCNLELGDDAGLVAGYSSLREVDSTEIPEFVKNNFFESSRTNSEILGDTKEASESSLSSVIVIDQPNSPQSSASNQNQKVAVIAGSIEEKENLSIKSNSTLNKEILETIESENYNMEEAGSEDIPIFVKENFFQ